MNIVMVLIGFLLLFFFAGVICLWLYMTDVSVDGIGLGVDFPVLRLFHRLEKKRLVMN